MPNVAFWTKKNLSEGARQMAKVRRWVAGKLQKAQKDQDAAYEKAAQVPTKRLQTAPGLV